jgi:hypothetical protein
LQRDALVMELRFRESAIADISAFIANYEESFFELYSDTGIWSEDIILENVRESAKKLFGDLFDVIENQLASSKVLGRQRLKDGWHEHRFRIGARLIIVHYFDDTQDRVRWVESIFIDRKPILF